MRKQLFVLCIVVLAIIATPIGASCQMTPLMGQIRLENDKLISIANGAIELAFGKTFNFSVWINPEGYLSVIFHDKIPKKNHPAIWKLTGSNGKKWSVKRTVIGDMRVTVLTTFIYPSDFAYALGIKRDAFSQEEWAANMMIWKMESLGKVTYWKLTHKLPSGKKD